MKPYSLNLSVLYLLSCLLLCIGASAQPCVNASFSLSYTASQSHLVNKSVAANDNTVITIGSIGDDKNSNAWISKRSSQGSVIWSRILYPINVPAAFGSLTNMHLLSVMPSSTSTYLINGYVQRHSVNPDGTPSLNFILCGVLMKIDESGNILWSHIFIDRNSLQFNYTNTYCVAALQLQDGNSVVYLQEANWHARLAPPYGPRGKMICIAPNGEEKWSLYLETDKFYPGFFDDKNSPQLIQQSDGNILLADRLIEYNPTYTDKGGYAVSGAVHLCSFRPYDGHIAWENSLQIPFGNAVDSVTRHEYTLELYSLKELSGKRFPSLVIWVCLKTLRRQFLITNW